LLDVVEYGFNGSAVLSGFNGDIETGRVQALDRLPASRIATPALWTLGFGRFIDLSALAQ
jgi:hypothetical protein